MCAREFRCLQSTEALAITEPGVPGDLELPDLVLGIKLGQLQRWSMILTAETILAALLVSSPKSINISLSNST